MNHVTRTEDFAETGHFDCREASIWCAPSYRGKVRLALLGGAVTLSPLANPLVHHLDQRAETLVDFLVEFFEVSVLFAVLLLEAAKLFLLSSLRFRNLPDDVRDLDQVFSQLDLVRFNRLLACTEPLHDGLSLCLPVQQELHGLFKIH